MWKIFARVAAALALGLLIFGTISLATGIVGATSYATKYRSGEQLYDGMPMVGFFITVAGGLLTALCGFAAWRLRGRVGGYSMLLLGLLLSYFPIGLTMAGLASSLFAGDTRLVVPVHAGLTAAGILFAVLGLAFSGRKRGALPAPH